MTDLPLTVKRSIELLGLCICIAILAIAESIKPRSECCKTTTKRMQHKLDELFKWLDTILEWATLHEREWMRELDAKLNRVC